MAHSCDFGEVVKKRRERRLVSSSSSEHLAHPLPQKDIINARDTSELRKSKSNERGTVTHGICVSHYFKRLFKYATERNFITRQQAKRACNKEFTRSGVPLGWKTPKRFVSFMKSFLSIPRTTARSWVEIFVTRLVTEKTKLLPIHTEAIKKIVCCFVNEYPVEAANETIPQSIHSLFEYLESHNIDIDNSLIGLEASKKFREKFLENTKNPSKIPLHENLLSETAREDLLNRFTKWSMCNDANLAVEVKEYITMLEQSAKNTIKCGDLVIVKTKRSLCPVRHYVLKDELRCLEYIPELENNATVMELHELVRKAEIYEESDKWDSERIVIGRVLQFDGAGILRISCDSIERVHVVVSLNQVFFFTDEMNSLAVSENARELIEDESDGIRVIMEDATEQILREYLQAHGTPYYVSVLDKTCRNTGQFESFLDFVPLQELLETIEEIIANPTLLLDTVNIKLAPLREKLLLKFAKIFVYHPARAGISERLSIEKYELLAMNLLANYQERCSNMIVLLENQVYMFFNGMQKLLLNEKCLKLLRKYLKPILEKEDFTTSIDNFNLLTSEAKHNIDIITQLQTDEVKLLEELIIPIREELLPSLEDYKTKAVQIVLTQLRYNSNMSKDGEDFDLEQITNEISVALKNNAPSHELYFVERLVGDIACIDRFTGSVDCMSKLVRKYIETMKCELQTIIAGVNTSISSSDSSKKKRNGAKRTSATTVSSSSLIFVEVDLFAYELFSVSDLATLNPSDVQAINNSFPVKVLEMNDFDSSADAPEELLKRSDFQQTNIIEPVKTLKSSNYCENSFVVPQKLPKKNRVVFEYNFSFDDSDSTGINSMSDMDSIGDETISIYINT